MALIPTIVSQIGATSPLPETRADASSFGGLQGAAMQQLGAGIADAGSAMSLFAKKQNQLNLATEAANFNYTERFVKNQLSLDPAKGADFGAYTSTDYDTAVTDYVNRSTLPEAQRQELRKTLLAQKRGFVDTAVQHGFQAVAGQNQLAANDAIANLQNQVRVDPNSYNLSSDSASRVIDALPNVPVLEKEKMKLAARSDLAMRRFDALIMAAKSPDDINGAIKQLTEGSDFTVVDPDGNRSTKHVDWRQELGATAFDGVADRLVKAKSTINTKLDSEVRASITSLNQRMTDDPTTIIPDNELSALRQQAQNVGNVAIMNEVGTILAKQDVARAAKTMPPAQLRQVGQEVGGGPTAFPNTPPEVVNGATRGAQLSGGAVSPGFLVRVMHREYGANFVRSGGADQKFAPKAVGNAKLEGMDPNAVDALTTAGQILGSPINVMSGYRSQEKQDSLGPNGGTVAKHSQHTVGNAVDVSTDGMDNVAKAKLVDALIQSGFTTFGEYNGHIHADMRQVTTNWQSAIGKDFSPEVKAVLERRGAVSGARAENIDRRGPNGAVPDVAKWSVDYGKSETTTSATGVAQFTNDSWLELMKQRTDPNGPTGAEKLGLNITGMSDAQILDLRKNPNVAGPALGLKLAQNKKEVESALGRPLTEAELYMTHFLGAAGATTFLRSFITNPDAIAADIRPAAAKNNHNVFYNKDGSPKTVAQVHSDISMYFARDPVGSQIVRRDAYNKAADYADKQVKQDPMGYAFKQGQVPQTPLNLNDPSTFAMRARQAMAMGQFYSVPQENMKPFTDDEAATLSQQIRDGDVKTQLAVIKNIAEMGQAMSPAAFKQLGEREPAFEFAATLATRGRPEDTIAAEQVLRGRKMLDEDKSIGGVMGNMRNDASTAFRQLLGSSVGGEKSARLMGQMFDAALAHYVASNGTSAKFSNGVLDKSAFESSVRAVAGATIGYVNGAPTILPNGLDAPQFKQAVANMEPADLIAYSVSGRPPIDATGRPFTARELANGTFQAVGGGAYRVAMSDGKFVADYVNPSNPADSRLFLLKVDVDGYKKLAAKPNTAPNASQVYPYGAPWEDRGLIYNPY